jgi:hypothetical protein
MAASSPTSRGLLLAAAGSCALLLAFAVGMLGSGVEEPPVGLPNPRFSLLAVGDTGDRPGWVSSLDRQASVAFGMEQEDRRERVDGVLFLGDQFYDHGLLHEELVDRVLGNLVVPFCYFVDLSGPRSFEVADACFPSRSAGPPPLYAVLGNHDVRERESPMLETRVLPQFVSNWNLPEEKAKTFELGEGVSLTLFDSNYLLHTRDPAPLREALAAARGPWRILAAHHPIGTSRDDGYKKADGVGRYGALVRKAVEEAGVPVQLMLAGHEHNLQVIRMDPPGPRLVVVSGGGSRPTPVKTNSRGRLFAREGLGFVRVDLHGNAERARLVVTLFAAPLWRSLAGRHPEMLARWSVTTDGDVFAEPLAATVLEPS